MAGVGASLDRLVRLRAGGRCEYCHLDQANSLLPFEIEHVIARKHGGKTIASNLALSCAYCNRYKGPNISGLDPASNRLTRLYHPRLHRWDWHFRQQGGMIVGRTAIGRTTVRVLEMNLPNLVVLREMVG